MGDKDNNNTRSKDLNNLSLEELMGLLETYKITMMLMRRKRII